MKQPKNKLTKRRKKEEFVTTLEEVKEFLYCLEATGSTCVGGVAPSLPAVHGLYVDDVGHCPVPITAHQAEALNVARQAPHGQGTQTIVDTSVRNTWQIEP